MATLQTRPMEFPPDQLGEFVSRFTGFVQIRNPRLIAHKGWVVVKDWNDSPIKALEQRSTSTLELPFVLWGLCNRTKTVGEIMTRELGHVEGDFTVWAPVPFCADNDGLVTFSSLDGDGNHGRWNDDVPDICIPSEIWSRHILLNMAWLYENDGDALCRDYGRHLREYVNAGPWLPADAVERDAVPNGELRWYEDDGVMAQSRVKKNEFHAQPLPLP